MPNITVKVLGNWITHSQDYSAGDPKSNTIIKTTKTNIYKIIDKYQVDE